jgi:hypothetical protein
LSADNVSVQASMILRIISMLLGSKKVNLTLLSLSKTTFPAPVPLLGLASKRGVAFGREAAADVGSVRGTIPSEVESYSLPCVNAIARMHGLPPFRSGSIIGAGRGRLLLGA